VCAPRSFRPRLRLLVIDPDADPDELHEALGPALDVMVCADAAEGLLVAGGMRPDLVVVAAGLPGLSADRVVTLLHRCCDDTPVLIGTGLTDGAAAAAALSAGATACVARPYRPAELLAVLRASRPGSILDDQPVVQAGSLVLDPGAHTVTLRGTPVDLPPQEFRLLQFLLAHAGRIVTRAQLWDTVWAGKSPAASSNTISVHVRRLRLRLGDDPQHPTILTTVGRSGYRLDAPT
jgi:DNA-binding response OmpR family regulator